MYTPRRKTYADQIRSFQQYPKLFSKQRAFTEDNRAAPSKQKNDLDDDAVIYIACNSEQYLPRPQLNVNITIIQHCPPSQLINLKFKFICNTRPDKCEDQLLPNLLSIDM